MGHNNYDISEFLIFISDSEEGGLIRWESGIPEEARSEDMLKMRQDIESFTYLDEGETKAKIQLKNNKTITLQMIY